MLVTPSRFAILRVPMSPLRAIIAEAADDYTVVLLVALALTSIAARAVGIERRRLFGSAVLCALHVLLLPVIAILRASGSDHYADVRLPALIFGGLAAVNMAAVVVFNIVAPRLHLRLPKILQDVVTAIVAVVVLLGIASRAGFNVTGLVATSAVLTAVIGFALQDTLGNIIGGLALQTDDSINVGDWIRFNEKEGRVTEVRWRYTAIETRDWETIFIPNSQLVKDRVTVLGRRHGRASKVRRWAYFNVDFRYPPNAVIAAVEQALRASPIANVASEPAPDCLLSKIEPSFARYAVRYYLIDFESDAPTDSRVMTRVYYGLRRSDIPIAMPAQSLFVTEETLQRKQEKADETRRQRVFAIERIDLLKDLSPGERNELATGLVEVLFSAGEILFHQGERGQCLYLLIRGQVAVRVSTDDGLERELARLSPGDFFGEMSLLTGAARSATVVAIEDVECYRLDKETFETILRRRPQVADQLAEVLAQRRIELEAAQENLDAATQSQRLDSSKSDLLGRIRGFFGIKDPGRRALG